MDSEKVCSMGKITFITGGARSGKSDHAERMAEKHRDVAYIATAVVTDDEMKLRIERHRKQRPPMWKTYEAPYDIARIIRGSSHEAYLVDCITVYITNLLLCEKADWESGVLGSAEQKYLEKSVEQKIGEMLSAMEENPARFIVVSNEVGMGLVPEYALGRIFRDLAGRANRRIAEKAEEAYFSVSGILIPLKKMQEEL